MLAIISWGWTLVDTDKKHSPEELLSAKWTPGPHQTKDQKRMMNPLHFQDRCFTEQTCPEHVSVFDYLSAVN